MAVGLRVLRGPHWSHGNEDEGEGHLGTLTSVPAPGTAEVTWDRGQKGIYLSGKDGRFELRIFDTGTVGVHHPGVRCHHCGEHVIFGMRWQCVSCVDVNLCPICYVTDRHVMTHPFLRFDDKDSTGVQMKKRSACLKIQTVGVFPGAKVKRGPHWNWGNQDGGEGSVGLVTSLRGDGSGKHMRSWVEVRWGEGLVNEYRLGAEGCVDIQCVEEAPGAFCYRDHLPLLNTTTKVRTPATPDLCDLKVDDKVTVHLPLDRFKLIQSEQGNWSAGMSKCIGKIGRVKSVGAEGAVTVEMEDTLYRLFRPTLRKVPSLREGDTVEIEQDEGKVRLLQESHGEFPANMKQTLGKVGKVKHIDNQGDVTVEFGGLSLLFHPALCLSRPGATVDKLEAKSAEKQNPTDVKELLDAMEEMRSARTGQSLDEVQAMQLCKAILKGDAGVARKLVEANPNLVNVTRKGVTPLVLASLEGELDIVTSLLTHGARLEERDYKGNTALCAAVTGQHEDVARLLMERGAKVNVCNRKKRTPLHLAAYFDLEATMKLLLAKNADVNAQDTDGDTPLHYAVLKEKEKALDTLLADARVDLTITNNKQFTPLQLAAYADRPIATEKLVARDTSQVNAAQPGRFASLHIAAVNGHLEVARILIDKGGAKVNQTGKTKMAPLHLACIEANPRMVDLLLQKGANVNLGDRDGDTPLHLTLVSTRNKKQEKERLLEALMGKAVEEDESSKRLKVACLLLEKGANYEAQNKRGKTPIEICSNDQLRHAVKRFVRENPDKVCRDSPQPEPPPPTEPQQDVTAAPTTFVEEEFGSLHIELPCAKCFSRPSDVIVRPCGHKVVCHQCQDLVSMCPLCDMAIEGKERLEPCQVQ